MKIVTTPVAAVAAPIALLAMLTTAMPQDKPSEQMQKVLDTLQSLQVLEASSSGDFALLYSDMQFSAHKEAVALFMTFEKGGDNATVQGFAARTLPTLAMHLMHVKAMVEKSST